MGGTQRIRVETATYKDALTLACLVEMLVHHESTYSNRVDRSDTACFVRSIRVGESFLAGSEEESYIAYDGDHPIGFLTVKVGSAIGHFSAENPCLLVTKAWVHPDYRKGRAGFLLLSRLRETARSLNAVAVQWVGQTGNMVGQGIYDGDPKAVKIGTIYERRLDVYSRQQGS